jgi:hypothetical protein
LISDFLPKSIAIPKEICYNDNSDFVNHAKQFSVLRKGELHAALQKETADLHCSDGGFDRLRQRSAAFGRRPCR